MVWIYRSGCSLARELEAFRWAWQLSWRSIQKCWIIFQYCFEKIPPVSFFFNFLSGTMIRNIDPVPNPGLTVSPVYKLQQNTVPLQVNVLDDDILLCCLYS
jgi:hypothetical protein